MKSHLTYRLKANPEELVTKPRWAYFRLEMLTFLHKAANALNIHGASTRKLANSFIFYIPPLKFRVDNAPRLSLHTAQLRFNLECLSLQSPPVSASHSVKT